MPIYGTELRSAVVRCLEQGERVSTLARLFGVSATTLWRWRREFRAHAQVAPRPRGRCTPLLDAPDLAVLEGLLGEKNDLTIDQLHTRWQQHTERVVSRSTLARAVLRLGWTRKKRACVPASKSPKCVKRGNKVSARCRPATSSSSMSVAPTSL